MKFRPCIDLHSGKVKQIVGSTLRDGTDNENEANQTHLSTNFATDRPAASFARMYAKDGLIGGHVIMLGRSPENVEAAREAVQAYPGGLQVGGGITVDDAAEWIAAGASHVIVTSYAFKGPTLRKDRLEGLVKALGGKERLVLDLSCRRRPGNGMAGDPYFVVTDRWQTFTDLEVNANTLETLAAYCDEFLVHGVDVEGKRCGVLEDLVVILGENSPIPVTYAGGVRDFTDFETVRRLGKGRVDLTVGSALDCFGGSLSYQDVVEWHCNQDEQQQEQIKE